MTAARTAYDLTLTAQLAWKLDRPAAKTNAQPLPMLSTLVLFACTMLAALSYFVAPALMHTPEPSGPTRTYVFHNGRLVDSFVKLHPSTASVASTGGSHAGLITTG